MIWATKCPALAWWGRGGKCSLRSDWYIHRVRERKSPRSNIVRLLSAAPLPEIHDPAVAASLASVVAFSSRCAWVRAHELDQPAPPRGSAVVFFRHCNLPLCERMPWWHDVGPCNSKAKWEATHAITTFDIVGGGGCGIRGDSGKQAGDCGPKLQVHQYTRQWILQRVWGVSRPGYVCPNFNASPQRQGMPQIPSAHLRLQLLQSGLRPKQEITRQRIHRG